MRKYQPGWIKLKSSPDKPLVISAHPSYHRRIYKAIIKEKDLDVVYKFECDEAGVQSRLSRSSVGNALTITLTLSPSIEALF